MMEDDEWIDPFDLLERHENALRSMLQHQHTSTNLVNDLATQLENLTRHLNTINRRITVLETIANETVKPTTDDSQ